MVQNGQRAVAGSAIAPAAAGMAGMHGMCRSMRQAGRHAGSCQHAVNVYDFDVLHKLGIAS